MLNKSPVNINFSQGVQTKVDPFQLPIGMFANLTNAIFTKDGLQQKRNGFSLLTTPNTGARTLCTLNGGLVILGPTSQSFNNESQSLTSIGTFQPITLSTTVAARTASSSVSQDVAVNSVGLACTTWLDSDGNSYYQVFDSITGQIVVSKTQLAATATMSRVLVIGTYFLITYLATIGGTTHLEYIMISTLSLNTTSPVTISTQAASLSAPYDIYVSNSVVYIALFCSDVGGAIRAWNISLSHLLSANITVPLAEVVADADVMSVTVDSSGTYPIQWITYWASADSKVYGMAVNHDLTLNLAPTVITSGLTAKRITSTATSNIVTVYYEVLNRYIPSSLVSKATNYVAKNTLTLAGSAGTNSIYLRGVGLASKAIASTILGKDIMLAAYGGAYQPTYYLIDASGNVLSRFAYSNGIGYLTNQILPSLNQDSTGVIQVGYLYADLIQAINKTQGSSTSGIYAQHGVNLIKFDFKGKTQGLEIASSLHVSGGMLWQYDGMKLREHSFNVWPEDIWVTGSSTAGSMTPGQCPVYYQVTYEWTDAAGMIHRSAPSVPLAFTILTAPASFTATASVGSSFLAFVSSTVNLQIGQPISDGGVMIPAGTYITAVDAVSSVVTMSANALASGSITVTPTTVSSVTVNIPTLRQTYKTENPVRAVVYRWTTTQQETLQVTSITTPVLNDTTVDYVTFTDTFSDAQVIGNNLIYTSGGVLENICAPGSRAMTLWQSRLFMADAEDSNLIWYSKQVIEATPIEMSDLLTLYIAPTTGAQGSTGIITAMYSMDDKLLIFKQDAIYYVIGTGPDNTGAQNGFSDPVYITSTVGCINPQSLVLMPTGVMFESDKGIWLLGRDLSTNYIGSPVETFTQGHSVTSAAVVPGTNQVRFTLDNNTAVMYDYYFNRWSDWDNVNANSSVIYQSVQAYLNTYNQVVLETPGSYIDVSAPVLMKLKTGWINLAGVQGFERFYQAYLLGVYITPFKLNVELAYDYNPSPSQSIIITPDNYSPPYGGDAVWGSGSVWGGQGNVFSERFFPKVQKCSSFQVTITELYDSSQGVTPGAGLTLSGMNLIVGMKKGYRTQSAKKSFG